MKVRILYTHAEKNNETTFYSGMRKLTILLLPRGVENQTFAVSISKK